MYLAPRNIPRAISVLTLINALTLGNKVILYCILYCITSVNGRFYIALLFALKQTPYAFVAYDSK